MDMVPAWMAALEDEDGTFIKKFILASGSLKEMAAQYGVSYPTVRLRLDRLIQKIRLGEESRSDPYEALVKRLAPCPAWLRRSMAFTRDISSMTPKGLVR